MTRAHQTSRARLGRGLSWGTALATGIAISAVGSAPAHAETEAEGDNEIIVTASGFEQSVIDVPYNISAVDGEELAERGITDLYGLTKTVPGLVYSDTGPRGGLASGIVIRGLSVNPSGGVTFPSSTEPTVSTYINNTPVFTNLFLSDISRVEVLRGPQGTLYGASAEAGTIRFLFNKPEFDELYGNVRGDVSTTRRAADVNYKLGSMINAPLAPNLALRLNADWAHNAGFIDIPKLAVVDAGGVPVLADPSEPVTSPGLFTSASDVNWDESLSLRAALRWNPVDALDMTLMYQHQKQESGGPNYVGYVEYGADSFKSSAQLLEPFKSELDFVSLEVESSLGFATLSSSSSYYKTKAQGRTDLTGMYLGFSFYPFVYGASPRPLFEQDPFNSRSAYIQEVRLTSEGDGPVKWIVGGFYRDESRSIGDKQYARGYSAFYDACIDDPVVMCGLGTVYPDVPILGGIPNEYDFAYTSQTETDYKEKAVYAEVEWQPIDGLRLTGGLRGYWQDTKSTQIGGLLFLGPDFVSSKTATTKDSGALYKIGVSYDITPELMLYGVYSIGQRPGGVNSLPDVIGSEVVPVELQTYSADEVRNIEAGIKGRLGGLGTFSLSAFTMDWNDVQVGTAVTSLVIGAVINAGDARAKGIEFEANLQLTGNLSAKLGYAYTKSTLVNADPPPGAHASIGDGAALPGVPDHMVSAVLEYLQPIADGQDLAFTLSGNYRGETHTALRSDLDKVTDDFIMVDAGITWRTERFDLKAYVNNLTDELGVFGFADTAGTRASIAISRPRTFGLSATVRY